MSKRDRDTPLALVLLLTLTSLASGQDLPTPTDAVGWALGDQLTIPEYVRNTTRYLWVPPYGKSDTWPAMGAWSVNSAASQTSALIRPRVIANGWMLAVDLRLLAPDPKKLERLMEVWDSLAFHDPYFHVDIEKTFVVKEKDSRGRTKDITQTKTIAVLAPHLAFRKDHLQLVEALKNSTQSPSLVYRLDWFITRLLDTDYYEFMQYGDNLTSLFKSIGINETLSVEKDGDRRVAIFISGITGKPRRIDLLLGVLGECWLTRDIFDENFSVFSHPLYNLLKFSFDGSEIIFRRANDLQGFALTDAQNNLVRVAPPNLAADHTIPAPHTRQLRPAISCIRCHKTDDGLKPAPNNVQQLIQAGNADVIDDFGNLRVSPEENVADIAAKYFAGNFDRKLQIAREDYDLATRQITVMPTKREGMTVAEVSTLISDVYGHYLYDFVDAETALLELGYTPQENPAEQLKELLPPINPTKKGDIVREDPAAAWLKAGFKITRTDWERIYPTARFLVAQKEKLNVENN